MGKLLHFMLKNSFDIGASNSRKPLKKLIHRGTIAQIFK